MTLIGLLFLHGLVSAPHGNAHDGLATFFCAPGAKPQRRQSRATRRSFIRHSISYRELHEPNSLRIRRIRLRLGNCKRVVMTYAMRCSILAHVRLILLNVLYQYLDVFGSLMLPHLPHLRTA